MCIFCSNTIKLEDYLKINNKTIIIESCDNLKEIPKIGNCINYLLIKNCKNLYKIGSIRWLKAVYILNCHKLKYIETINNLESVHIENCFELEIIRPLSGINYYSINDNEMKEASFKIRNCALIATIPKLYNFRKIDISYCPKLNMIYPSKSIYELRISNCNNIKDISRFYNLVSIYIREVPIQFIPQYENLRILSIYKNDFINTIQSYPNLTYLFLYFSNNIEEISYLPKLKKSEIIGCENIKYILSLPNVRIFEISYTDNIDKLELPNSTLFYTLSYKYQIYHRFIGKQYPRDGYGLTNNMYKLIKLQKWIRKYLYYKRFVKYIKSKEFNQWFYHPNGIGGRTHIKYIYKMLEKI